METLITLVLVGLVAWAAYKLFFEKWIIESGAKKAVNDLAKTVSIQRNFADKDYYAVVADEIKRGVIDEGLQAQAFVDARGDRARAEANYLRMRAEEIRRAARQNIYAAISSKSSDELYDGAQAAAIKRTVWKGLRIGISLGAILLGAAIAHALFVEPRQSTQARAFVPEPLQQPRPVASELPQTNANNGYQAPTQSVYQCRDNAGRVTFTDQHC